MNLAGETSQDSEVHRNISQNQPKKTKTKLDPRHCCFVSHEGSVSILYSVSLMYVTASSNLLTTTAAFTVVAVCCHFKTVVCVCECVRTARGTLSM